MARFNEKSKGSTNVTENFEGAKAYKLSPEMELYTLVCTSILKNKYYRTADEELDRLRDLLKRVDHTFAANLAVYAREKMYLRTIPLVIAVELGKIHKGDSLISRLVGRIIQRADEITEIVGYYRLANEIEEYTTDAGAVKKLHKLSPQLKKGLGMAFNKFNEYQMAKYNRDTDIKLRDVMFLARPKPEDKEKEALFKAIADDTLEVPYTWEVEFSRLGGMKFESAEEKNKAFRDKWEEMIDSKKLGYMATMRNLRNMLDYNVSKDHVEKVVSFLTNPEQVARSKQLPFRFYAAYKELKGHSSPYAGAFLGALNDAIWLSVDNLVGFNEEDTVLIGVDDSGSMSSELTRTIDLYEIGALLGVILRKKCKYVTFGCFSHDWRVKQIPENTPVLDAVNSICNPQFGTTNAWTMLDWAKKADHDYNKIYMFTDMQIWDSEARLYGYSHDSRMPKLWNEIKERIPSAELTIFDLAGYGTTPVDSRDGSVNLIAGWSDKIFSMLESIKNGSSALEVIKQIEL